MLASHPPLKEKCVDSSTALVAEQRGSRSSR